MLDARAAALFDLPPDVAIPRPELHGRIHPDDIYDIECQVEQLLDPTETRFIEVEHRVVHTNGDILWLSARKQIEFGPSPVEGPRTENALEAPVSGLVAILDITQHKRAQERIVFLMEELNHRPKNLLTVVQSLSRRTFATRSTETFNQRFSDRLNGLVRNHDALVRGLWTHSDLSDLATSHLRAFAPVGGRQIQISVPSVKLGSDANQSIGMVLHELATNTTKYGALSVPQGRIDLTWQLDQADDDALVLTWIETGGPAVSKPTREGFGQKVIKNLAAIAVGGKVDLQYRLRRRFLAISRAKNRADLDTCFNVEELTSVGRIIIRYRPL